MAPLGLSFVCWCVCEDVEHFFGHPVSVDDVKGGECGKDRSWNQTVLSWQPPAGPLQLQAASLTHLWTRSGLKSKAPLSGGDNQQQIDAGGPAGM